MLVQDFGVVLKPVDKTRRRLVLRGTGSYTEPVNKGIKRNFRVVFNFNYVTTTRGQRRVTSCIIFTGYVPIGYGVAVQYPKDKNDNLVGCKTAMRKAVTIAVTNMLVDGTFTENYRVRKWIGEQSVVRNGHAVCVANDAQLFNMISNKIYSAWSTKFGGNHANSRLQITAKATA